MKRNDNDTDVNATHEDKIIGEARCGKKIYYCRS